MTSKHNDAFYCLKCLYLFRTKNELALHKKVCENKSFCCVGMPSEDTRILEFNRYHKSDKTRFNIYADLESLIEKNDFCKNNPAKSFIKKVGKHISSSFSMSTISSFKGIENQYDVYRGKDCMKKFSETLREHTMKIINSKKKKMKLLTND